MVGCWVLILMALQTLRLNQPSYLANTSHAAWWSGRNVHESLRSNNFSTLKGNLLFIFERWQSPVPTFNADTKLLSNMNNLQQIDSDVLNLKRFLLFGSTRSSFSRGTSTLNVFTLACGDILLVCSTTLLLAWTWSHCMAYQTQTLCMQYNGAACMDLVTLHGLSNTDIVRTASVASTWCCLWKTV